jgi:formate hydrogenlyase transcriptional activator
MRSMRKIHARRFRSHSSQVELSVVSVFTPDLPPYHADRGSWEAVVTNNHVLNFSPSVALPSSVLGSGELDRIEASDGIVGHSSVLADVLDRVRRVGPTDLPVLITGETGTGKELVARAIHRRSSRATRQFVPVNLAALPKTLAAAELFGHERGAFTGADRLRQGRFESADRGTLFLDEIGELRTDLQVMLLRVLQEGDVERLGGGATRRVDVRLVAATNRDLGRDVREGRFREDLFYRLNVFPIHVPPLRKRADDIPGLAGYFLRQAGTRLSRRFRGIEPESLRRLQQYHWPGNIRQLQNVIEQSAVLCDDAELDVPEIALTGGSSVAHAEPADGLFAQNLTLEEVKKRYISHLLSSTKGNMVRTAAILDVDRRSLYRLVARYHLGAPSLHRQGAVSEST